MSAAAEPRTSTARAVAGGPSSAAAKENVKRASATTVRPWRCPTIRHDNLAKTKVRPVSSRLLMIGAVMAQADPDAIRIP
eukprot:4129980-Prymnesium_polylepis.1